MQSALHIQAKSRSNLEKHGIDFLQAQAIWDDPDPIEVNAQSDDEPRAIMVGKLGDMLWSAVVTYRESKVRIISVRRARQGEATLYEG